MNNQWISSEKKLKNLMTNKKTWFNKAKNYNK